MLIEIPALDFYSLSARLHQMQHTDYGGPQV